jgi:hypothetical protein
MCQFMSGIAYQNGDIITSEYTDSHEHLLADLGLSDGVSFHDRNWVRVEYTGENLADIDTYALKIDEHGAPEWCDADWKQKIAADMKARVKRMILLTGERPILLGGTWILGGDVKIKNLVNARVILMRDTSQVGMMWDTSWVGVMRDTSQVGMMWDTSQVGMMWDTSRVGAMRENSQVGAMRENSQVGAMRENSQVSVMWETSQVLKDTRVKK